MEAQRHDVIGIGFGPANIALAIAFEELFESVDVRFLERRTSPMWQPGMLLEGSDIQHHPLRDLVTPRNPRSRYSFTNFLFESGRLFEHLNLPMAFPLRTEYAQYVEWAAHCFDRWVRYGAGVERLEARTGPNGRIAGYRITTASGSVYESRAVVVAPGRTPFVPAVLERARSDRVVHLVDTLDALARRVRGRRLCRVAVVGGSQSAVEILLHLARQYPEVEVVALARRYGFRQKDTSPFTGEVYFPEFVRRFYEADARTRARLREDLHHTNYSASDKDVLDELYRTLYEQKLRGGSRIRIERSVDIVAAVDRGDAVELAYREAGAAEARCERFDLVVSATGFRDVGPGERQERCPPLLGSLLPFAKLDEHGCIQMNYDYSLVFEDAIDARAPCFVNGLCESSHGMGDAGSFSLLSLRSREILEALRRRLFSDTREPSGACADRGPWPAVREART